MKNEKQVAVRLSEENLKKVKQYCLDNGKSFQSLVVELLSAEVGLNQKEGK